MSVYNELPWLPLCGGLTLLGFIASWFIWRRRGAAAGLRAVAWSLLPLVVYLIKAVELLWRIGAAIVDFATSFVFSPQVWLGIIVLALAVVLFGISGVMRRRRPKGQRDRPAGGQPGATGGQPAASRPSGAVAVKGGKRTSGGDADDDLGDVADILRRHGIR